MIPESEINQRAGKLADTVVNMLTSNGVFKAAVMVSKNSNPDIPLSIRTPSNKGFGYGDGSFHLSQSPLLQQAKLQVKFASRTSGRSRLEQLEKQEKTKRNASSWGLDLPPELEPGFAHDLEAGLIVVATLEGNNEEYATRVSERAIKIVDSGTLLSAPTPDASELIYACGDALWKLGLPKDRTGFVMMTHPIFRHDPSDGHNREPLIICSQSFGSAVDELTGFPIVAAKAGTVALTGKPSGPDSANFHKAVSQIKGGLPISTWYGDRVLAAGGLPKEEDDVAAIQSSIEYLGEKMGIALLSKLSRR